MSAGLQHEKVIVNRKVEGQGSRGKIPNAMDRVEKVITDRESIIRVAKVRIKWRLHDKSPTFKKKRNCFMTIP